MMEKLDQQKIEFHLLLFIKKNIITFWNKKAEKNI
jgi:hypothetical protein